MTFRRFLVLLICAGFLGIIYMVARPLPNPPHEIPRAPESLPGDSLRKMGPLPPPPKPDVTPVMTTPIAPNLPSEQQAIIDEIAANLPQRAIAVNGVIVRPGFGPPIQLRSGPDGRIVK